MTTGTSSSRLDALYADFSRQIVSNPAGFEENYQWWSRYLSDWTARLGENRLTLRVDQDLWTKLRQNDGGADAARRGRPLALPIVVAEEARRGRWQRLDQYMKQDRIWTSRLLYLWSLLYGTAQSDNAFEKAQGEYVLLDHVNTARLAVLSKSKNFVRPRDHIFSRESFAATFRTGLLPLAPLSDQDIDILIRELQRRNDIAFDGKIIKFRVKSSTPAIDQIDEGILALSAGQAELAKQISSLQDRQAECEKRIRENLGKNKDLSMSYLKSKKSLEHLEKARWDSYHNLENLLSKIEQAIQDAEILKAYKTSSETLQAVLRQKGLQPSVIEETMDQVSETLAAYTEVQEAMESGQKEIQAIVGFESPGEEIDDELSALIDEMKLEEVAKTAKHTMTQDPKERKEPQQVIASQAQAASTSISLLPNPDNELPEVPAHDPAENIERLTGPAKVGTKSEREPLLNLQQVI